jgi:hypothetical protein
MKLALLVLFSLFCHFAFADDAKPVLGWQCSEWFNSGKYYLYCGGAYIDQYSSAQDCVNGRKQICGPSIGDFECREWPDHTFYLYCGTVNIGHYNTAKDCVKNKRQLCD